MSILRLIRSPNALQVLALVGAFAASVRPASGQAPIGERVRFLVGLDQVAASSAQPVWKSFYDFYLSVPAPLQRETNDTWRMWGLVRVASTPQQISGPVKDLNVVSEVGKVDINQAVATAEFLVGTEWRLHQSGEFSAGLIAEEARFQFSLFATYGGQTPMSPTQAVKTYLVTPEAEARYPVAKGKKYIAFTTEDRSNFFREWWVGMRFRTVRYKDGSPTKDPLPLLDLALGQNQRITRGAFRGVALRFDGFFPFPWEGTRWLYLFGHAQMRMGAQNHVSDYLFLEPASGTTLPDPDAVLVSLPPVDKDWWRVGMGVNVADALGKIIDKAKN